MRSKRALSIVGLPCVALGVTLAVLTSPAPALASGPPAQTIGPGSEPQISAGGQVTIAVVWRDTRPGLVFAVTMDTHVVDLDRYDLAQLAVLRTDQGQEIRPSSWVAPSGGHHREGTLSFAATAADGSPLLEPSVRAIELVIRDVASVPERVFRWAE